MDPDDPRVWRSAWVRDVVFDDGELARRARTALAAADHGVVSTVAGIGQRREQLRVEVFDDDGEPVLVLPESSGAAVAARAGRLGSVGIEPVAAAGVRLRLTGRLAVVAAPAGRGPSCPRSGNPLPAAPRLRAGQTVAALRVEGVYVGCPCPYGPARDGEYRVPVESYAAAVPDYLAAHAPRMAAYLNTEHADRLRCLAARLSGQSASRVAAATVTGLSRAALELRYVDGDGAHDRRIELCPAADGVVDLASTLMRMLRTAAGRPAG